MPVTPDTLVLGTRGSKLALVQADSCADALRAAGLEVEVRVIKTTSEHRPDVPLSAIDQRDVFTRQLDEALLGGELDLAVHSLKDVPTEVPEGTGLAAIGERHGTADALVSEAGWTVDELPTGAVVATSSLRRKAQLLWRRPDLSIVDIRGNVDTRIRKMRDGEADALVLAHAGLVRLGLDITVNHTVIPPDVMLPAVGQGALAVAVRQDHPLHGRIRATLNHEPTEKAALAERAMLRALEGGCRLPVGASSVVDESENGGLRLEGIVASPDGAMVYRGEAEGVDPEEVGWRLARDLISQGAETVLAEIREVRS
ncbi:hydroxymethylbilane synthase [Rubrobacter aplysinae]|uniref:hydroxymethylbilane synthase n=1 Tax=Rubrobacter aplysinae TaxID=909625 RepID=UPI00064BC192|nr:hydroxymethylbilane synthase [Rubrobacter aplysinae]